MVVNSKRILWISHIVPYPPVSGGRQRSFYLLKEISKDHDVFFIGLNPHRGGTASVQETLASFCREARVLEPERSHAPQGFSSPYLRGLFSIDGYSVRVLNDDRMARAIHETVAEQEIELLHFDTIGLCQFHPRLSHVKSALNHHNIESHMTLRRARKEKNLARKIFWYFEGWKLRRYERKECPRVDINLVCSDLDRERLRNHMKGSRIEVIPNPVDISYFRSEGRAKTPRRLVFAGGMDFYPNRDAMTFWVEEIWPEMKKKVPGISITVIGIDPPGCVQSLGRADADFRVLGFVEDVRPYLDEAEVYVCPVRDGGGTKLKVLHAMAMGVPVVAHPVACEGLDVVDGEHVRHATRVEDYVATIQNLLSNKTERERLASNARRLVESNYAVTAVGRNLSNLYGQL